MISLFACGLIPAIHSDPKQRDLVHAVNPAASGVLQGDFVYNNDNKSLKYNISYRYALSLKHIKYIFFIISYKFALHSHSVFKTSDKRRTQQNSVHGILVYHITTILHEPVCYGPFPLLLIIVGHTEYANVRTHHRQPE